MYELSENSFIRSNPRTPLLQPSEGMSSASEQTFYIKSIMSW